MYHTRLRVECAEDLRDLLIAQLAGLGFDAFMETDGGFEAYAEEDQFNLNATHDLFARQASSTRAVYEFDRIEKRNWNEEWEKGYDPIDVEGRCLIRADFHKPARNYPYEIIITPKMSFGTGHHQTTYLMVKRQMQVDHRNKRVMDAGCGTAILSVMASKLGARKVEAFDIDEWSVINGNENIAVNRCANIRIQQGTIADVRLTGAFDVILANINKNVLLAEMGRYRSFLAPNGILLLSGFYTADIADLVREAGAHGMKESARDEKETWAALQLEKAR